jgi:hypothetical protein
MSVLSEINDMIIVKNIIAAKINREVFASIS